MERILVLPKSVNLLCFNQLQNAPREGDSQHARFSEESESLRDIEVSDTDQAGRVMPIEFSLHPCNVPQYS